MLVDVLDIVAAACAYLLGSIPTALLLVRAVSGKDIRFEGSGNVGARNSYEVTGKLWVGVAVGLLDAAKGALAVLLAHVLTGRFVAVAAAAVSVVLGHNWSVFLRGRGGRGLAPACGATLAINPLPIALWLLMYATGYFVVRRHVHVGNVAGSLGTAILIFNVPGALLRATAVMQPFEVAPFKLAVVLMCVLVVLRHIEPMRELFRSSDD